MSLAKTVQMKTVSLKRDDTSCQPTLNATITEHACPVCSQPLELYKYTKDNQPKQMLRCSDVLARKKDDHKNVAFFASKNVFWSPIYGEIGSLDKEQKLTTIAKKTKGSQSSNGAKNDSISRDSSSSEKQDSAVVSPRTNINQPCPVCKQPLELYEYFKGNEKKQMLRCSNVRARQQPDHKEVAFFASRGAFWSSKFGEINNV